MGHKTSHNQNQTKQFADADAERARLAKIFTRLALATAALLVVITFFATTGLCDFALLNPNAPAKKAYADGTLTETTHLSATIESACLMSSETVTPKTITIANGALEEEVGKSNVKIACNDAKGWSLYSVGYGNNTLGDTNMSEETTGLISPIATGLATTGGTSSWAMKIVGSTGTYPAAIDYADNTYAVIPSAITKVAHFNGITDQTEGSKITTSYRIYAAPLQPAGTYTGKVKYTLVHPEIKTTGLASITYMQDITPAICTATPIGTTVALIDKRDMTGYSVARLKDGNCWMTSNLKLLDYTLSATDSDVTAGGAGDGFVLPDSIHDWTSTFTAPMVNYQDRFATDGNGDGAYYNYNAASAGTVGSTAADATASICPKGWTLPTGGNNGQFQKMSAAYGNSSASLRTGAASLTLSGIHDFGGPGVYDRGSYGMFWSVTAYNASTQHSPHLNASSVVPAYAYRKDYGCSVRCIARAS